MIIQALSSMVTILAVIALGYLLQAKGWFQEGFSKSIADLILKIALPASIFVSVLKFITREQLVSFFGISLYPLITVILGMGRCCLIQSSCWQKGNHDQHIRQCEHGIYGIAAEPLSFWRRSDAVFPGLLRNQYVVDFYRRNVLCIH